MMSSITITRQFKAPREAVWKAWVEPLHFKMWWGPKNFTCPSARMDVEVGGEYIWCMQGPDKQQYWTTGEYEEVVPMEKLVYTDSFADEHGHKVPASHYNMPGEWQMETKVTVLLVDKAGGTEMIVKHEGIPEGEMSTQCSAGWNESFDKLAKSVE